MHATPVESRRPIQAPAALLAALLLVACGAEEDRKAQPATPTTVSAAPEQVVAQQAWHRGRVQIAFPDGLAVVGDAVYVKTDDGHVVRVDPATHEVEADVRVDTTTDPDHYCQGIGTDGRTLWACSAAEGGTTDVVRLDPETLEVRATVKVDKVFDQLTLPVSGGRVWVLTEGGEALTAIDTATNQATTHPLSRPCLQAAANATTVYVTCLLSNEVVAVDIATGKVSDQVAVTGPYNVVAAVDEDVWVSGSEELVRLSAELEPRTVYPGLVAGREGDLLLAGSTLWIRQRPDFYAASTRRPGR